MALRHSETTQMHWKCAQTCRTLLTTKRKNAWKHQLTLTRWREKLVHREVGSHAEASIICTDVQS